MRSLSAALCAVLLATGCGTIQEAGNLLDRAEACAKATEIADGLVSRLPTLTGDPAAMRKALDEAAGRLRTIGVESGDPGFDDVLGGLAETYKSAVVTDAASAASAAEQVRAGTATQLRVISRSCGDS
ncbi:hypothetical protein [Nonomuraea longicatena]|uniref:Lipoprotein n=1 Tax=Nonomuraea longicatena TaxID=83682 RepID=A0ABN1PDB5_9ACTN